MQSKKVPPSFFSSSSDAPGWKNNTKESESSLETGPTCWKCEGNRKIITNKRAKKTVTKECAVCRGKGYLPVKKKEQEGKLKLGVITRTRRTKAQDWKVFGPISFALIESSSSDEYYIEAQTLVKSAAEVSITCQENKNYPVWIPKKGEELCNLVGSWRILQRVGSHRWTTDDLVTAYVAAKEFLSYIATTRRKETCFKYLDLGCGNASVLQMTTWNLLGRSEGNVKFDILGVEARKEAYELATRSISYNIGPLQNNENPYCHVDLKNQDFRSFVTEEKYKNSFDFITGTPPYFRIEYTAVDTSEQVSALIRQGGMPSCMQSAPARCEFRGGIEAYCEAAEITMKPNGIFVVCEAWIHHERVFRSAKDCGLTVRRVVPIKGKTTKPDPLFGIYVMQKQLCALSPEIMDAISVRENDGTWTKEYCEILDFMSIPN